MHRSLQLAVLTLIAFCVPVVGKASGQSQGGVQVRLEKACSAYDVEIKKLNVSVEQHFSKLEKTAETKKDPDLMSQIAAERADFGKVLELPLSISPTVRQRFVAVRKALFRAYATAMDEYEQERHFTERGVIERALQALKDRTAGLDLDGSGAARIAGLLGATNKYQLNKVVAELSRKVNARLVVQIEETPQEINIADSLPNRPFLITEVHFPEGTAVKDNDLLPISALSELKKLSVRGSDVTDLGVRHLAILRKMKSINLHATKITDQSLFKLAEMGTLEDIDVGYNQNITDKGMHALGALNGLRSVNFGSQNVTPEMARWIQTKLKK